MGRDEVGILNCSKCGREPEVICGPVSDSGKTMYFVCCPNGCVNSEAPNRFEAVTEWNRVNKELLAETPRILDSGNRTEFATGAVRDMRAGKGRMDLMPLGVVEELLGDDYVIVGIRCFMEENDTVYLLGSLREFARNAYNNCYPTMLLEVGKHFEEGAKKYGENNWQKGIEPKYYVDSAIRHYLKWRRGDKDEPHDRAFVWNIMCCIWEVDWHDKEKSDVQKVKENIVAAVKEINNETDDDLLCSVCKYTGRPAYDYPCNDCYHGDQFKPKEETVNGQR